MGANTHRIQDAYRKIERMWFTAVWAQHSDNSRRRSIMSGRDLMNHPSGEPAFWITDTDDDDTVIFDNTNREGEPAFILHFTLDDVSEKPDEVYRVNSNNERGDVFLLHEMMIQACMESFGHDLKYCYWKYEGQSDEHMKVWVDRDI